MPAVSNDSRLQMQRVQNYNSVFGCCHRSKENHLIPNNFLSGLKKKKIPVYEHVLLNLHLTSVTYPLHEL